MTISNFPDDFTLAERHGRKQIFRFRRGRSAFILAGACNRRDATRRRGECTGINARILFFDTNYAEKREGQRKACVEHKWIKARLILPFIVSKTRGRARFALSLRRKIRRKIFFSHCNRYIKYWNPLFDRGHFIIIHNNATLYNEAIKSWLNFRYFRIIEHWKELS